MYRIAIAVALFLSFVLSAQAQNSLPRVTVIPSQPQASPSPAVVPTVQATQIQPNRPSAQAQGATSGAHADDPAAELMAEQAKRAAAYQQLNQSNPLSADAQLPPEMRAQLGALGDPKVMAQIESARKLLEDPQMMAQIEHAKKLLDDPMIKRTLEVVANPLIQESAKALVEHPKRKVFLYTQITLFIIWIFVRSYQMGRARTFLSRVGVSLISLLVYIGLGTFVIPTLLFGKPYVQLLTQLVRVLRS